MMTHTVDALPAVLDVVDGRCDECRRTPYPDPEACRCGPPSVWDGHPLTCQTCADDVGYAPGWMCEPVPFSDKCVRCPDCVDGHPIIDLLVVRPLRGHQDAQPWPGYHTVRVSISARLRDDGRYDIIATEVPT